ncbi:Riboflavin synthase alpha chain [Spiromyces aspiralis]|uniref:Riboflavin synthase alpha chain n=1 Tax=Spiromyces aspiralis TaxID=68401 RepID=A0ACC1HVT5_9FUNG|nr:Riboflavin synthase alpha chain [Spiromyces aspiralis]
MFTGIVETMGTVRALTQNDSSESGGNGVSLEICNAEAILSDCHLGDSIAVNGTCLTVTQFDATSFKVGLAPETLHRTNLGKYTLTASGYTASNPGDRVNLERALAAGMRFGGHFVQGHIDTTAEIVSITPEGNSLWFKLKVVDKSYMRYIIPKGFIAIDGTSLTVCDVDDETFTIMLVAYTQSHVVMPLKKVGDYVNIEVDMLGKYADKIIATSLIEGNDALGRIIENIVEKRLEDMRHP